MRPGCALVGIVVLAWRLASAWVAMVSFGALNSTQS